MAVVWSKRMASVTSKSSFIRSTMLVEFHNTVGKTLVLSLWPHKQWLLGSIISQNSSCHGSVGYSCLFLPCELVMSQSTGSLMSSLPNPLALLCLGSTGLLPLLAHAGSVQNASPWIILSLGLNQLKDTYSVSSCFFNSFYWAYFHLRFLHFASTIHLLDFY